MSWIRVDVDYDRARWLRDEKRFVKDAWPNLLRHVKTISPKKGRIKWKGADDIAYALRYEPSEYWAMERLIEVGLAVVPGDEPALRIENGELVVVNWFEYQSAEAARSRKHRESLGGNNDQPELPPDYETGETDKPVSNAIEPFQKQFETDSLSYVTARVACDPDPDPDTGLLRKQSAGEAMSEIPTLDEVAREALQVAAELGLEIDIRLEADKFRTHYEGHGWKSNGKPIEKWKPFVRSWLLNSPKFQGRQARSNGSAKPPPMTTKERLLAKSRLAGGHS